MDNLETAFNIIFNEYIKQVTDNGKCYAMINNLHVCILLAFL